MKKSGWIYGLVLVALVLLSGCSVTARLKKADKKYAIGEYYAAADAYRKAQSQVPSKDRKLKAQVAFKTGECYRSIGNYRKASTMYNTAIRYKYSDSIVFQNQAKVMHAMGNYRDAIKFYTIYLQAHPYDSLSARALRDLALVDQWKKNPTRYVVRLATEFNSKRFSDFAPVYLGSDGSSIIFTSNRDINGTKKKASAITGVPNNDMLSVRRNASNKWEAPVPFEGEINTTDDEGVASVTADGKLLYFSRCKVNSLGRGGEICESTRAGGTWTAPKTLALFKDSTITVSHPAISADGNTLYFVSDAPDGVGGKDIWRSTKNESGWDVPENMRELNTTGDEMFPMMRADGTLFFSSNGRGGFGGFDIFKATFSKEKGWLVENMLAPINSNADDLGITFEGNEERGYFSSNRNQGKGVDRIWYFELPQLLFAVEGKVLDEKGDPLPDAVIRLVGTDGENVKLKTKKDGSYKIKLQPNVEYVMMASSRGHLNSSGQISTLNLTKSNTFKAEYKLVSVSKPVKMENIFYEFGKWDLTTASLDELQGLVKLLNDNPNITIELSAHTDMVGSDQSNMELSAKRAKSVVDYLIKLGIEPDRLTSKGYGKSQPVTVSKELANKYSFLKEGQLLDEAFINTLTDQQKEIANQINRRTEFRVTRTTYKMY